MKEKILVAIIAAFEQWANNHTDLKPLCSKGCSVCCTQNVNITALEGENILRYIQENGKTSWFAERMTGNRKHVAPRITTNDFAKACLDQREIDQADVSSSTVCPFLEDNLCSIYEARPFSCRLFISTQNCSRQQPATVPDYYFEASTAVTQLIEHLGQREYWGNMLDVLLALLDIKEFKEIGEKMDSSLVMQARLQTLTAKPLPGFLLTEEESDRVTPLLESIFSTRVQDKTIEDFLNGR